jgi:hypothetical protein
MKSVRMGLDMVKKDKKKYKIATTLRQNGEAQIF